MTCLTCLDLSGTEFMFILHMTTLFTFLNLNLQRLLEFTGLFSLGSIYFRWAALLKQLSKSLQTSSSHEIYLFIKLIKLFAKQLVPILFRCNPLCAKTPTLILLLSMGWELFVGRTVFAGFSSTCSWISRKYAFYFYFILFTCLFSTRIFSPGF